MLQSFCLVVNLIPRIVQDFVKKTLQQAMVAQNLQRAFLAGRGQTRSTVLLVIYRGGLLH